MSTPPRGTVTFVFTDIEGSTRLLLSLGRDRYGEMLREHQRLLREAWQRHGGFEVDTEGDAFFVAFAHATDAVAAAADAQRALAGAEWPERDELRVRVGIHSGEASEQDGKYVGLAVHRAARIAAAAHGGQVLVSEATRALAVDEQLAGGSLRDLGLHRLKDLTEPQRLFQLLIDGLPVDFPPLRTLENRPTNLPSQHSPLVGREREMAELLELLDRADVRLLTLTGPGGVGKTRLALQLAAERIERFEHGVFFVNLAALTDPALVLPTIAQTVAVHEQPGEQIEQTLAGSLRDKRMLLVLDNFERVLDAAGGVAAVLRATDTLMVVVTSRARLQLTAEHEYPVGSLSESDALTLFTDRAQAVKPNFSLNGNRPTVAEICARLDNLPLAIELAAARVKLLTEHVLLRRLDQRLRLLTGGARDLDERQRTLRAAIDWSHGLLDESEQPLFRRLAVFAGGRTLDAIETVCDADGDLGIDVIDGLASLVDKSLLRQEEGADEEPRFVMLETIHEYAREKLEESGEAAIMAARHAAYFAHLCREAAPHLVGGRAQAHWFARLEEEVDNMRAALRWCRDHADAECEFAIAASVWWFWWLHGYVSEGRGYLLQVLEYGTPRTTAGVDALEGAAYLAYVDHDRVDAKRWAEELLKLAREIGDSVAEAKGLHLQALLSDSEEERLRLESGALELAGDHPSARFSAETLGIIAFRRGNFAQAREYLERSCALSASIDDTSALGSTLILLALVSIETGDVSTAARLLSEGAMLAREIGEKTPMVWERCWIALALLMADSRSAEHALAVLGAAERVREGKDETLAGYTLELHERAVMRIGDLLDPADAANAWATGRENGEPFLEKTLRDVQRQFQASA